MSCMPKPTVLLLSLLLVLPVAASAADGGQTRQQSVIRSIVVDAPSPPAALLQALGRYRGAPLTPAVRNAAQHAIALATADLGWRDVTVDVPDTLSANGLWRIRLRRQVPAGATPATPTPQPAAPAGSGQTRLDDWLNDADTDVLIVRNQRSLYAKLAGGVQRFPVALGRRSAPTPTGMFQVQAIAENPTWYPTNRIRAAAERRGKALPRSVPPGPGNPLGKWFVALGGSIGIHGNNSPWSIGRYVSSGCIRMHNDDIAALVAGLSKGRGVWIVDSLQPDPPAVDAPPTPADAQMVAAPARPAGQAAHRIRTLTDLPPSPFHP